MNVNDAEVEQKVREQWLIRLQRAACLWDGHRKRFHVQPVNLLNGQRAYDLMKNGETVRIFTGDSIEAAVKMLLDAAGGAA